nr:hypothetical protein [Tanacetum cinerariifolium]
SIPSFDLLARPSLKTTLSDGSSTSGSSNVFGLGQDNTQGAVSKSTDNAAAENRIHVDGRTATSGYSTPSSRKGKERAKEE